MPDHFYVYPAYLSKEGSRSMGRRVPAQIALGEMNLEQLKAAAESLGYTAEVEEGKQYPRQFYTYAGRLKVTKKKGVTKTRFLRELAEAIRRETEKRS